MVAKRSITIAAWRCTRRGRARFAHDGIIAAAMLHVVFSNRFEALLDGLVGALAEAPASPFEAQHVVVPSIAVRRKVELALADQLGICANVEFSFLGAWLWRQIARL